MLAVIFYTDLLCRQLGTCFGRGLDEAKWTDAEDYLEDGDLRIAEQFAYWHRHWDEEPSEEQVEGPDKE
jgi:hypothetical protein